MLLNKEKKHGVNFNPRLALIALPTTGPWLFNQRPGKSIQWLSWVQSYFPSGIYCFPVFKVEETEKNYIKLVGAKQFKPVNLTPSKLPSMAIKPPTTLSKLTEGITELAKNSLREEEHERDREFWIFASQVADRIFFIVFAVVLICSTTTILSEVPDHYSVE